MSYLAHYQLTGKTALVTGSGQGIGASCAQALAEAGAHVYCTDLDPERADASAGRLQAAGMSASAHALDVTDTAALNALAAQLPAPDILVCNAGIVSNTPAQDMGDDEWQRVIDVNLTGHFLCTRRAVPLLKAAGGGCVINLSSVAGKYGYAFRSPYSSSKFGVIGFTECLAKELGPAGIRVNAILPGMVEGERVQRVIRARAQALGLPYEQVQEQHLQHVSMRRMVSAQDIAAMAGFLLSRAGSNISGQSIAVDANVETL